MRDRRQAVSAKRSSAVSDVRDERSSERGLDRVREADESIQIYWSAIFILPQRVLHDIEQLLCAFLWAEPDLKCSSAKVAWHAVSVPKEEGGLGIRWLKTWNKASMLRHLWAICMKADTLWIKWIHTFVLKKHSLWRAKIPHDASWTVRKLLKLRDMAQPWIQYVIGDGKSTYLWADNWHNLGPLYKRFGDSRDFNVGRPLSAKREQELTIKQAADVP
ncbi:hypothetical protein RHSIM_Rhsim08G0197000 [Rhododendron simsii]|uniref:Reverse transcriptase zinc-binding domain-containing protein n=1 Tax=Rhododendron simsii TaxID=118357 RepID=A0A834LGN8_RHOSS|nr:hypothetical protein RHSIM_Rhsim08G0197000 [Rhododendron simsii]